MRVVLAIVVGLTCPLAAAAQPAGDRYGPASPLQVSEAAATAYQGRALSWANKQVAPQPPQPQQPLSAPSPVQQQRAQAPTLPPPPSRYQPPAPAYVPFQPQVPLPLQQPAPAGPAKAVQRPPTSIYGALATPPQPVAPAAPAPAPALVAAPAAAPKPIPQRLAQAAPAQPALQRVAQPKPGGTPRLYSVHRDFGMTPDVIEPTKGDRYVLIGPPDAPTPKSKTDDDDDAPDARPGAF